MKQFNLSEWLKDKSRKVVTRDKRPVRIVCTDSPILHHPIVGFVEWDLFTWTDDGKVIYGGKCEDKNDLFFADEEEELTEFDYAVLSIISDHNSHTDSIEAFAKRSSKKLLDLARKEILKDLPKWKKATKRKDLDYYVAMYEDEERVVLTSELYKDEYYIKLEDLKTLPKEE